MYYFIQIHGIVDGEIKENATIGASENYNADVVKEQMIPELKRRHRYGKTFEVAIIAEENVSEKTYFDAGFSNWTSYLKK